MLRARRGGVLRFQLNHVSSGLPRIAYMYWLRDFLMTSLALSTVCCLEYTTVIVLLRCAPRKTSPCLHEEACLRCPPHRASDRGDPSVEW